MFSTLFSGYAGSAASYAGKALSAVAGNVQQTASDVAWIIGIEAERAGKSLASVFAAHEPKTAEAIELAVAAPLEQEATADEKFFDLELDEQIDSLPAAENAHVLAQQPAQEQTAEELLARADALDAELAQIIQLSARVEASESSSDLVEDEVFSDCDVNKDLDSGIEVDSFVYVLCDVAEDAVDCAAACPNSSWTAWMSGWNNSWIIATV